MQENAKTVHVLPCACLSRLTCSVCNSFRQKIKIGRNCKHKIVVFGTKKQKSTCRAIICTVTKCQSIKWWCLHIWETSTAAVQRVIITTRNGVWTVYYIYKTVRILLYRVVHSYRHVLGSLGRKCAQIVPIMVQIHVIRNIRSSYRDIRLAISG